MLVDGAVERADCFRAEFSYGVVEIILAVFVEDRFRMFQHIIDRCLQILCHGTVEPFDIQRSRGSAVRSAEDIAREREVYFQAVRLDGLDPHTFCCLLYTSPSPRDRTRSR